VWSVKCGVWSVVCGGVRNVVCVECRVWWSVVECGEFQCGVWSVVCRVRSEECGV